MAVKSAELVPWIAVDLDGTLAEYHGFEGHDKIGKPIKKMVDRVNLWLDDGALVKIFTARAAEPDPKRRVETLQAIAEWSLDVFGTALPVTCIKDYGMVNLWDDRCVQVIPNTGERVDGKE